MFKQETPINDSVIYKITDNQGVDMPQFEKDFNDSSNLKELLQTKKYLIEHNIYTTPTFIVNDIVLDDELAIYQLKNILENELH